jgi:putative ABC transport system permease protein
MRSALTMLGVIIGIAAFIAMVSVGEGAANMAQEQIQSFGANVIFVGAGSAQQGHMRMGAGQTKTLVIEDMHAILSEVPIIRAAAPGVGSNVQVVYENQNWATRITGSTPTYLEIRNWGVSAGSTFSEEDVAAAQNVCLLGQTVATNLFGAENPVGQVVRIRSLPFRVIGLLAPRGQGGMGDDQDDMILAPYTTVQKKIAGITWLRFIMCSAVSREASSAAVAAIQPLLRQRHNLRPDEEDDFMVRTQADVAQLAEQTGRIFTRLLGSIAFISLLVGGIGIMNIMLVSVTERTREIGVRMAVGATEAAIRWQFLTEAVTLSVMGGIAGIIVGVSTSMLISSLLRWPTTVSPLAIATTVGFSVGVGVFFGYYPARKASQLDPIEALRYE